ncbi:2-methoxy-6-polyprenyl-1,4-benzoquinol methylase, mitochondrial [Paenibacillus auburnensis]|uniref:2-methoxy-6-polyprenyl-1,4-benzoquinol methylase, mitochondrial n=1 Tax=Paenibacillus auburnensis TaxID=2905649 RepID=A0ABN8GX64_9BACL|nr:daptide-type RiPP biosynthesis methyltransferase [Paenibacillus auburnensis]CAH1220578.1 2-methoxy-6-polyprenyl-1,4-benzoquinol methylase, mitochondrial [Paenibacillus auburnensis]
MYFGVFQELRNLNMPGSVDFDLYEGYYSEFYEAVTGRTDYDIALILEQAGKLAEGRKVLELACGSGRILMHLANRGFSVTGLDLSEDMLKICRKKQAQLPARLSSRIETVQGDMTDFKLGERFPLIVLSATSISLLRELHDFKRMLGTVEQHLEPGGRFIFDYVLSNQSHNSDYRGGRINSVTLNLGPDHKQFVLIGEEENLQQQSAVMNFYAEVIQNGETKRIFGSTFKKFFAEEDILQAIDESAFRIAESHMYKLEGDENVRCLVLEREADSYEQDHDLVH